MRSLPPRDQKQVEVEVANTTITTSNHKQQVQGHAAGHDEVWDGKHRWRWVKLENRKRRLQTK